MNESNYKSFQDSVVALLEASPNNSNKGKVMKEWFNSNFGIRATVSNIKEDKQIGNRVVEQFKHNCPIVVFVFDSSLRRETILNKVQDNVYDALQTVVFVNADNPYNIVQIFTTKPNDFTEWAEKNADVQSEAFPFPMNAHRSKQSNVAILKGHELTEHVREAFMKFWNLIDQHGADYNSFIKNFENTLNPPLQALDLGYDNIFQVIDIDLYDNIISKIAENTPDVKFILNGRQNHGWRYEVASTHLHYKNYLTILANSDFLVNIQQEKSRRLEVASKIEAPTHSDYLRAMRTKPFLLLAGISGTGKSRIVKQMAFDSCPDKWGLRADPTSPGNYCLVEVKPNWHDSTELLGYKSKIGGAHYQATTFVKFLAKAMLHPDVPFFVCLDEMNLAPVEQYFAEFLSVLESRTKKDGHIISEPLIKAEIFAKYPELKYSLFNLKKEDEDYNATSTSDIAADYGKEGEVYEILKRDGLRIPENVVVVGTVNMDETTHQFSRKVIDRAMTIEMNLPDGEPFMDFFSNKSQLIYRANPTSASLYISTEVKASDVIDRLAADNADKTEWLKGEVAKFLTDLNSHLDGTPFKVAYRVQNELLLYFYQLWLEDKSAKWRDILTTSCDQILMMKVLPRIEGDVELLSKPLEELGNFFDTNNYHKSKKKIAEMKSRLDRAQFTSFWP